MLKLTHDPHSGVLVHDRLVCHFVRQDFQVINHVIPRPIERFLALVPTDDTAQYRLIRLLRVVQVDGRDKSLVVGIGIFPIASEPIVAQQMFLQHQVLLHRQFFAHSSIFHLVQQLLQSAPHRVDFGVKGIERDTCHFRVIPETAAPRLIICRQIGVFRHTATGKEDGYPFVFRQGKRYFHPVSRTHVHRYPRHVVFHRNLIYAPTGKRTHEIPQ